MKTVVVFFALLAVALASDVKLQDADVVEDIDSFLKADPTTGAPKAAPSAAAPSTAAPSTAAPSSAAPSTAAPSTLPGAPDCKEIVSQINLVRTNPSGFAKLLAQYTSPVSWSTHPSCVDSADPKCLFTRSDNVQFLTHDGVNGILDAIKFLNSAKPVGAVKSVDGLCLSAGILVREQGRAGEIGHTGPTGSSSQSRIFQYGLVPSDYTELVQYGAFLGDGTVFDVVAQLIVGDGDAKKLHRAVEDFATSLFVFVCLFSSHFSFPLSQSTTTGRKS